MRFLAGVSLFVLLAGAMSAQTVLYGPSPHRGFPNGHVGPETIVRDSGGNLYVIYRHQISTVGWRVAIARSTNQGSSWNMTWQSGFDTYVSGSVGNIVPCMAIDRNDNLHCAWWHRPGTAYTTHYNRYEAATQSWGTEQTISTSSATDYPLLTVDNNDYVWLMYYGPSGHNGVLARSNLPFAADLKFSTYAPTFTGGSASSNADVVIDALGRLHVSYYTTSPVSVSHKWIDPCAATPTWSAATVLSQHYGHASRAEYASSMAADNAGNVYVIYPVDSQYPTSNGTFDTQFFVRKWDNATVTWGNPVLVHSVPYAVWGANKNPAASYANDHIISAACDETSGEFYFAYRDFSSGDLTVGRWRGIDTEAPTVFARVMPVAPPGPPDYFLYPHFRGSLWPRTNRASWGLDLIYSVGDPTASPPSYTEYFEHCPLASIWSAGAPKIGTTYPLDLSAVEEGGQAYVAAVSVTPLSPMIRVDRRYVPIVPDAVAVICATNQLPAVFVHFHGVLSKGGTGQAQLVIPNLAALVNLPLNACFLTYDPSGIRAISNPWGFVIAK
ncbi:MAG: hypothetical protein JXQ29_04730 [Planctomycetes bacterium]|nr:hypothetical protein [Planctomycetota bacterium]